MRQKIHDWLDGAGEKVGALFGLALAVSVILLGLGWMRGIDLPAAADLLRYVAVGVSVFVLAILFIALAEAVTKPRGRHD